MGTFSKAIGTVGGFVAGSAKLIAYLKQRARPFLFSSALPAADVGATLEAFKMLEESDAAVQKLWANAQFFKKGMAELGFDTGLSATPITPVMIGDADKARKLSALLFDKGIFAMAIGFPTVAQGKARIRVMISAAHEESDLQFALEQFAIAGKEMGIIA